MTAGDAKSGPSHFRRGFTGIAPLLVGVAPFAMVAGLAGPQNGISKLETAVFSGFANVGAAQIAALELIGDGSPVTVVIATATIINLRFLIYSASLAPHFAGASFRHRMVASYLLVDHAVALSLNEFGRLRLRQERTAFYFGASVAFWLTWQTSSLAGSLLGGLPTLGILAFSVPLSFLGLLAPLLREHAKALAAAVSAIVALIAQQAPANTGLLAGTLAGLVAGFIVVRRDKEVGRADEPS